MRVVLITTVVYVGLLLVFLGVRQYQLKVTIHERIEAIVNHEWIANATMIKMVALRPVDHQHTLFSGVLVDQIRNTFSQFVHSDSEPDRAALYELVAMSPCNPRIHNCS